MKLRYSNNTAILYKHTIKTKNKKNKLFKNFFKRILNISIIIVLIIIILFSTFYVLNTKGFFNIKNVDYVIVNTNEQIIFDKLMNLKNKNLIEISKNDANEILNKYYPGYGVKSLIKIYPHTLKIVLYKQIPVLSINNKYIVYNDGEIKKSKDNVNCIPLYTNKNNIKNIFSIPGLATIYPSLIRYKDIIKSVKYKKHNYYIKLKNKKIIVLHEGQYLKNIDKYYDFEYRVIDLRYKNLIIVNN